MMTSGANLKWTQEGRTANFIVDGDSPLAFCKEALLQFQLHVARIDEQVKAQAQAESQKTAEAPTEEKGSCDVIQE